MELMNQNADVRTQSFNKHPPSFAFHSKCWPVHPNRSHFFLCWHSVHSDAMGSLPSCAIETSTGKQSVFSTEEPLRLQYNETEGQNMWPICCSADKELHELTNRPSEEMSSFLWKTNGYYGVHNRQLLAPILRQVTPNHNLTSSYPTSLRYVLAL